MVHYGALSCTWAAVRNECDNVRQTQVGKYDFYATQTPPLLHTAENSICMCMCACVFCGHTGVDSVRQVEACVIVQSRHTYMFDWPPSCTLQRLSQSEWALKKRVLQTAIRALAISTLSMMQCDLCYQVI